MKLTELEAYREIKANGFQITSETKGGLLNVSAKKDGLVFTRTGKYLEQCVKSLWHDIKNYY